MKTKTIRKTSPSIYYEREKKFKGKVKGYLKNTVNKIIIQFFFRGREKSPRIRTKGKG